VPPSCEVFNVARYAPRVDFPDALRPGDRVAIVAPSSPFPREAFLAGLAWLAQRYVLSVHPRIFDRTGFLAGTDEERAQELSRALTDPDVRAILVARGGYGASRIVSRLPWNRSTPRWLVGFSDTTALHVVAMSHGLACVHGPHVTGLGASDNAHLAQNRARLLSTLESPSLRRAWNGLHVLRPGTATGPLFGGNLTLLCTMAAANLLRVPRGAIVLLEDVTERPYRVDRMLTSLLDGGHLSSASALVFGSFDHCDPTADNVQVDAVLAERAMHLQIPVLANAPFGHAPHNETFPLGVTAHLSNDTLRWPT
jgi:muramoyltetrapeptide carboxypeptidase